MEDRDIIWYIVGALAIMVIVANVLFLLSLRSQL